MRMLTRPKLVWPNGTISRTMRRYKNISPRMFVGMAIPLVVAMAIGLLPLIEGLYSPVYAATTNVNCTVIVPPNPLSAQGLMTPYQLVATDPAQGPCNEANTDQSAFVQAVILDPATGQL